jgi:hypothetical protein
MLKKIKLKDLVPFDRNPRKNKEAIDRVLESLKSNGYISPIVVCEIDHPFKQHVIAAGHTRFEALKKFGAKEVNCFVHKFDSEAQFVRYNIEDNKTAEFAEWDETILDELSSQFDIDLKAMDFEFTGNESDDGLSDDQYTKKISSPVYEPKGDCPEISEMINFEKHEELLNKIKLLDVDDNTRDFLEKASTRHIMFNYGNIAEYYSHASKDIQEIMEDLALVIVDFEKAIEDGYVELSEEIRMQYLEDHEK